MPNYVYDDTAINFPKTDLIGLPVGADPDKHVVATDWNVLHQAVDDIKTVLRGADWLGLGEQAADPAPVGITEYLWLRDDGTLFLHYGGADIDLTAAGGGGGSGDVVGPAGATDNAAARYDLATGKLLQDSPLIITDLGDLSGIRDIALSGVVDGRDIAVDGAKLDGIAPGATVGTNLTGLGVDDRVMRWDGADTAQSSDWAMGAAGDQLSLSKALDLRDTITPKLVLENTTPANNPNPRQNSPALELIGYARDALTVASEQIKFGQFVDAVNVASGDVEGSWSLYSQRSGGTVNVVAAIDQDGSLTLQGDLTVVGSLAGPLVSVDASADVDLNGVAQLILDADQDTFIESSADDLMNLHAGVNHVQLGSNTWRPISSCALGAFNGRWTQIHTSGRQTVGVRTVSDNYTVSASDDFFIRVAGQGAAKTVTLPAASSLTDGWMLIIANDDSTDSVTLDGDGGDTVNGSPTRVLATGERIALIYVDATQDWIAW